ncbi:response regulator [Nonomuraea soli]|uniref:DNA-binding NarL/FixJ family response regulator n=1 Tax=Nonomuraea soli TaxID=1032476 RepID=A0A7W0CM82_9ACTN|nr:response regulator transcription factor [Nonomuraea soli]MBA2893772.1 DNA-binding NarL/FixJ family response regulator [Nonomuraea soli]
MSQVDRPITIVLVDDHALFREGVREILEAQGDLVVVGEAGTSATALELISQKRPDVLLLDVEIPGGSAAHTVTQARALSPSTQIIILSMYDGPHLLRQLLQAGIRGYLLKTVHRYELVSAIRSVHFERDRLVLVVSPESLAQMEGAPSDVLTSKEREVLELVAQALSNRQIASRLNTTEATVKRHLRNIFVKLGAASRIDAVNRAIDASLITPTR